jgi:hypothetical protein
MNTYTITTSQRFTKNGILGAFLFVFAPIVQAGAAAIVIHDAPLMTTYDDHTSIFVCWLVVVLASLVWLASIVMMLIGRETEAKVMMVAEERAPNVYGLWAHK